MKRVISAFDVLPMKKTRFVPIDDDAFESLFASSSSSYSPSSATCSPYFSLESESESESEPEISPFFKDGTVPFTFDTKKDGYILNSKSTDRSDVEFLSQPIDRKKALFSRSILSYENGSLLTKHIAPWGEKTMLCHHKFVLKKKIYGADGNVAFVLIKDRDNREIALEPAFFDGWADVDAISTYYKYINADK